MVAVAMGIYVVVGWLPLLSLLLIGGFLNAAGRSLQTPALSALTSHTADPSQQGATFGLFHMLGSLARVIGPLVAGATYTAHHTGPYWTAGAITVAVAGWTSLLHGRVRAGAITPRDEQVAMTETIC